MTIITPKDALMHNLPLTLPVYVHIFLGSGRKLYQMMKF
jgi:hypothetical protein